MDWNLAGFGLLLGPDFHSLTHRPVPAIMPHTLPSSRTLQCWRTGQLGATNSVCLHLRSVAEAVNGLKYGTDMGALVWDGAAGHRSRLMETAGL